METRVLCILGVIVAAGCGADRRASADAADGVSGISGVSAGQSSGVDDGVDDGGDHGTALDVGVGGTGGLDDGGEGGACPCENVLDGIYVLDSNAPPSVNFYAPLDNQFSKVGDLGCPAPLGATANSMAIDRGGHAWLNYYTLGAQNVGQLFRAPLSDLATCEDLGYQGTDNWFLIGMGYSVNGAGDNCDRLYLYNSDQYINYPNFSGGSALGRWDEGANMRVDIGPTNYAVGELSGTGDGRLFAFATVAVNQSILVEYNKADGSELATTPLDGLDITNAFAFAFWGGDVYFFTETNPGSGTSKVTRLDHDNNDGGGLSVVNADTGLMITGAGVSTCASYTPQG